MRLTLEEKNFIISNQSLSHLFLSSESLLYEVWKKASSYEYYIQ
jgi:hypothetical protein